MCACGLCIAEGDLHTNTYTNTPGHVKAADSADSSEPNPTMHVVFCPAAATSATTSGAVSEPGVGLGIWATGHCGGQGTAAHTYASKLSGARKQQGARARQKTCIAGHAWVQHAAMSDAARTSRPQSRAPWQGCDYPSGSDPDD